MKLAVLILTFVCNLCYAQDKVEDIKTEKDVISFIEKIGNKNKMIWRNINFNQRGREVDKYLDESDKAFVDSATNQRWIISDFNSDGKKDLVAAFHYYQAFDVFAFVSNITNSYDLVHLGNHWSEVYPSGLFLIDNPISSLIKINHHINDSTGAELRRFYRSDTLIYKFSGFVEYKESTESEVKFDSIVYNISPVWIAAASTPKMILYNTGKVKLFQSDYVDTLFDKKWKDGIKECAIYVDEITKIEKVLGIIGYSNLKSNYNIYGVSDLTTYLTVVYSNGKKISVSDRGGTGTYGLRLLYRELFKKLQQCRNADE